MKTNQAIFILGNPGSGKDVIIRDITSNYNIIEFTSSQIDEMLSSDAAFKRAKFDKQNSLLESRSIIVTANSFDLSFMLTKHVLESIGYNSHLIIVEADLSTSIERLKNRKNIKESLERISIGNSNKHSILKEFDSYIEVDNSQILDLIESRSFVFSVLEDLKFESTLTLDEILNPKIKSKFKKVVMPNTTDATGETITFTGKTESVDFPYSDQTPWGTPNMETPNRSPIMQSDQDKKNVKRVLKKTQKILFKHSVIPMGI